MANFISMYQYTKDTFSVIHTSELKPQKNDQATVFHKTMLHAKNRTTNALNIIEIIETRPHKTDHTKMISIVRCENQIVAETIKEEEI